MTADLAHFVRSLRACTIAVVGDVMLDRYVSGRADRLSPEAPIPVLDVTGEQARLGGAANVAMKAAELGATVLLVGAVGDDEAGREIRALLDAGGIRGAHLAVDPARPTTVKTRLIARNQQLMRVDREKRGPFEGDAAAELADAARVAADQADAVILEDYGKGALTHDVIRAALAGATTSGAPVLVDPHGTGYSRYAGATVLTPNVRETEIASALTIGDDEALEAAADKLTRETSGAALAITREGKGISLFRREGNGVSHVHVPTRPIAVFDVTGAGDAVAAAMSVSLASGLDLEQACAVANLAGRAIVRQFGVGSLSAEMLLAEANEQAGSHPKIVDRARAAEEVRRIREAGGKVVFTNGCFDILHYGHAHLLQAARAEGDCLVLGLNTDDSVRRLKGDDRPLVPQDERAQMLALYPFVDLVVMFGEDTPEELIRVLKPDILVKGGDYTPEQVVGRELVESWGGRVAIVPLKKGHSTSNLVEKIRGND